MSLAPRRIRKGKIEVLVKESKRKYRKPRKYWRKKRPKAKKSEIRVSKDYVLARVRKDKFGRIYGLKVVKAWEGRK